MSVSCYTSNFYKFSRKLLQLSKPLLSAYGHRNQHYTAAAYGCNIRRCFEFVDLITSFSSWRYSPMACIQPNPSHLVLHLGTNTSRSPENPRCSPGTKDRVQRTSRRLTGGGHRCQQAWSCHDGGNIQRCHGRELLDDWFSGHSRFSPSSYSSDHVSTSCRSAFSSYHLFNLFLIKVNLKPWLDFFCGERAVVVVISEVGWIFMWILLNNLIHQCHLWVKHIKRFNK